MQEKMHQKEKKLKKTSDRKRNLTSKRLLYKRNIKNQNYQKVILSSLKTETGFETVCSCCLQYKSKSYCKPVNVLPKEKVEQYILNYCSLVKTRSEGQYVCNLCLQDIRKDKIPRRSKLSHMKFANFPDSFIQHLKKSCMFKYSSK